jgi:hypothetical protein
MAINGMQMLGLAGSGAGAFLGPSIRSICLMWQEMPQPFNGRGHCAGLRQPSDIHSHSGTEDEYWYAVKIGFQRGFKIGWCHDSK